MSWAEIAAFECHQREKIGGNLWETKGRSEKIDN